MSYVESSHYDSNNHKQHLSIPHVSSASSSQYSHCHAELPNAETFQPVQHPFDVTNQSNIPFPNHIPINEGSVSMMSGHSANRTSGSPMMTTIRPPDDTMSAISSRAPPPRISSTMSSYIRKQTSDFHNMQQQLNEMRQAKLIT